MVLNPLLLNGFFEMLKLPNNIPKAKTLTIVKVLYPALINQYFLITYV